MRVSCGGDLVYSYKKKKKSPALEQIPPLQMRNKEAPETLCPHQDACTVHLAGPQCKAKYSLVCAGNLGALAAGRVGPTGSDRFVITINIHSSWSPWWCSVWWRAGSGLTSIPQIPWGMSLPHLQTRSQG